MSNFGIFMIGLLASFLCLAFMVISLAEVGRAARKASDATAASIDSDA